MFYALFNIAIVEKHVNIFSILPEKIMMKRR